MLRHGRGESGTTIVEIVVGLAVGTLLVAGILVLIEQAQKTYFHSSEVTDLQQNVRVAMDRMVHIIQAAGVNPVNKTWGGATPTRSRVHRVPRSGPELHSPLRRSQRGRQRAGIDENVFFFWPTTPATGAPLRGDAGHPGGAARCGPGVGRRFRRRRGAGARHRGQPRGTDMFQYFTGAGRRLAQHAADSPRRCRRRPARASRTPTANGSGGW